jgi:hypothetical protein
MLMPDVREFFSRKVEPFRGTCRIDSCDLSCSEPWQSIPIKNENQQYSKESVMNRLSVISAMVLAASVISTQAVYAAPTSIHTPVNAIYSNAKMVNFTLRNDSSAPLKVMVGNNEMTLQPGKPVNVKLATGQTIVAEETTASNQAGAVLATAIPGLDGATVSVR